MANKNQNSGQPSNILDRIKNQQTLTKQLVRVYKRTRIVAATTSLSAVIMASVFLVIILTFIVLFLNPNGVKGDSVQSNGCYSVPAPGASTAPAPVSASVGDYFNITGGTIDQRNYIESVVMYTLSQPKVPSLLHPKTDGKITIAIKSADYIIVDGVKAWLTTDGTGDLINVYGNYFSASTYIKRFYINHEIGHAIGNRNNLNATFYNTQDTNDPKCFNDSGIIKTYMYERSELWRKQHESFAEAYADSIFCKPNESCRYTGGGAPPPGGGSIQDFPNTCNKVYAWMVNNVLGTTSPIPMITVCPSPEPSQAGSCESIGGSCAESCPPSSNPTYVKDTTGATCSDAAKPACCVPPLTMGADLPAGILMPPFKCGWTYSTLTYNGHSSYSVDFNRGSGNEDLGEPVYASANGTVSKITPSYGWVQITHKGGYETWYVHMINIRVKTGQHVLLGQQIGEIGRTYPLGSIYAHLHYRHLLNGIPIKMAFNGVPLAISIDVSSKPKSPLVLYYGKSVNGPCY